MDKRNRQTSKGILCLRPVTYMASLGLWTSLFCILARISPTFCSVAFPSNHAPVFLGWHVNGVSPLPRPAATTTTARRQGPLIGRRARQLWTTCRRRCTSDLCSSRLRTADPSTHETRGQACWSCPPPVALPLRGRADPSLNNQTCSLRAKPACCDFAHLALLISQHLSASSKRKPRYRLCIFGAPDQLGDICPRAYVRESNPCDKRRGFLVLPSASCSATPQRSRPNPQQLDMFAPGDASLLSFCQPRALHITSIASRAARACLGTVSAPFFLLLPTGSELCPRAGILESRRNNQRPRQPVLPFCLGSTCLLYTSPSPRDQRGSRMPSSA